MATRSQVVDLARFLAIAFRIEVMKIVARRSVRGQVKKAKAGQSAEDPAPFRQAGQRHPQFEQLRIVDTQAAHREKANLHGGPHPQDVNDRDQQGANRNKEQVTKPDSPGREKANRRHRNAADDKPEGSESIRRFRRRGRKAVENVDHAERRQGNMTQAKKPPPQRRIAAQEVLTVKEEPENRPDEEGGQDQTPAKIPVDHGRFTNGN